MAGRDKRSRVFGRELEEGESGGLVDVFRTKVAERERLLDDPSSENIEKHNRRKAVFANEEDEDEALGLFTRLIELLSGERAKNVEKTRRGREEGVGEGAQ